MIAHTPGPWTWGDDFRGLFGSGQDNEVLTHYHYEGMHLSYGDKQTPNARLIAAAPDLLAQLRTVVFHLRRDDFRTGSISLREQAIDAIEAAIAKATEAK